MNSKPSFAFAGSPKFAVTILDALLGAGWIPKVVLTQPDRRVGRGRKFLPTPVKQAALAARLPVRTTKNAAELTAALTQAPVDMLVVVAFGIILPSNALQLPRLGCINVHASLLPRWRGAAPIEHALIAGDEHTGTSIMHMDVGLDTGPVYAQEKIAIPPRAIGLSLAAELAELGGKVLLDVLPQIESLTPRPQLGPASLAPKLKPADSAADWQQCATALDRRIRALGHRAPVFTTLEGTRVQLLSAQPRALPVAEPPGTILASGKQEILVACGTGALDVQLLKVNRGKGRAMQAGDARNGFPKLFRPGVRFL